MTFILVLIVALMVWHYFDRKHDAEPKEAALGTMLAGKDPWSLDFPLFQWSKWDAFTLRNAVEAVCIMGELGAAKSTGSAAWILLKYLAIGMGGLVCCVKPGERELIEAYAKQTGRDKSLIIVSPGNQWKCNLIRYVLARPGITGSRVEAVVSLLMTIVEAAERGDRGSMQEQAFWRRALRQILRDGIQICIAARGDVTMRLLNDVIGSAPRSPAEVHDKAWQGASVCYQLICEAEAKEGERTER